jgi:hypothetical protein
MAPLRGKGRDRRYSLALDVNVVHVHTAQRAEAINAYAPDARRVDRGLHLTSDNAARNRPLRGNSARRRAGRVGSAMVFYLGTGEANWLETGPPGIPLCVSRNRLAQRRVLPRRRAGRWILDSGAFTMLQRYGRFTVSAEDYVAEVLRFCREIGRPDWVSPQDYMCEPVVLSGGTCKGQTFVHRLPAAPHLAVAAGQRRPEPVHTGCSGLFDQRLQPVLGHVPRRWRGPGRLPGDRARLSVPT